MRFIKLSALMFILLFNGVLLLGVLSFRSLPAVPGGGAAKEASRNGDVNGDGSLNISDAVYLLKFMFNGGPAPVAIAQGGGLTPDQEAVSVRGDPESDCISRLPRAAHASEFRRRSVARTWRFLRIIRSLGPAIFCHVHHTPDARDGGLISSIR